MAGGQDWTEGTVKTLLNRLLGKGAIAAEKEGRRYSYRPVLKREDYVLDGTKVFITNAPVAELFLVYAMTDASRGFAVGAYGMLYRTEDGGQTWAPVDSPIRESELHFNAIARLNDGALFIAGEQGTLAVSSDAGQTWTTVQSPYDSSLFGAAAHGDKGVVIFGLRGNVFVADDAQKPEWRQVETNSVASMFGATQTEDGRLVMVGLNGNIMVSGNGLDRVDLLKSKAGTPLSAAIPFGEQILAVGESGVQPVALQ